MYRIIKVVRYFLIKRRLINMKVWKKVFSVVISAVMLTCSVSAVNMNTVFAEDALVDSVAGSDFEYSYLDDGTIEITKWTGSISGSVKLPETVDSKTVSSIGRFAFYNKYITSVSLPETLVSIGEYAFSGCSSLREITIPDSVTTMQANVFAGCENLKKATFSKKLKAVPEWAFAYCSSLTEIEVPESVSKIGNGAFIECSDLKSITVLNNSCDIYSNGDTISSTATIYGYSGSSAQKYALDYGRNFIELSSSTTTTTTTATTTTTKQTTSTTVSITTTTTTTPQTNAKFKNGSNNWQFPNSRNNFGDSYYMNNKYWNALLDGLSNREKEIMKDEVKNAYWGGSCYGMAVTSILSCYDILKPSVYQKNAQVLHDISAPPSDEVKSLINYYYAIQMTDVIQQEVCKNFYNDNEKEKLQSLISCLEDGSPTLLCYHGLFPSIFGYSWGGHAVVAYGVEYGNYTYNGKKYDGKVITYDNNAVDYYDDYCLYFSTSNWSWCIPNYELDSEYNYFNDSDYNALLGFITDDLSYINYHGYLNGVSKTKSDNYIAVLRSAALSNGYSLTKAKYSNGIWNNSITSEDEIKRFSSIADSDFEKCDVVFALKDADAGYIMKTKDNENLDLSLSYESSYLSAKAESASSVKFSREGCIEVSGKDMDYSLKIISDYGNMVNDWYAFSVTGNDADNVTFEKADNGYILKADDMTNVLAQGYDDYCVADITFSTNYDEVYLYEIDKYTIGVAVDTDNNGTYETIISKSNKGVVGDINNDKVFNIADVVILQRWLLNDGTNIVNWEYADLCHDRKLDVFDLCLMKHMLISQ